jgi:hypothetical protein
LDIVGSDHAAPGPAGLALAEPVLALVSTSHLLQAIIHDGPPRSVTLDWFFCNLRQRSFGVIMLFLGLAAMMPGISVFAGLALAALGIQMLLAHETPVLPRILGRRSVPAHRVMQLVERTLPFLKALERFVRPRWRTPFVATKRFVGLMIVILAATICVPIPLSNVIPGAMTMLVAFAYLEEDGLLLSLALTASLGSLLVTVVEVCGVFKGADFLLRL